MPTNRSVVACQCVRLFYDARLLQLARFDHRNEDGGGGWAERESKVINFGKYDSLLLEGDTIPTLFHITPRHWVFVFPRMRPSLLVWIPTGILWY